MSTIDSEQASKVRAMILNIANKVLEAYQLTQAEKFDEARRVIYDIDRFDISTVRAALMDLEFEQKREEEK